MFGCNRKYNISEIAFLLTKIYPFDPKMNLHSHFHFNSFPGHSLRTATQREREKRNTKQTHTQRERELRSLNHLPRPPIHKPIPPIHEPKAPIHEPRPPIHERPIQLSQTHTGPATSVTEPITFHGEFSVTGSSSTHSPHLRPTHVRSTHSPHRFDLCIYLFIYLFTFILFITFFNYQCFIKIVYLWVMYMKCWSFSVCRLLKIGFWFAVFFL